VQLRGLPNLTTCILTDMDSTLNPKPQTCHCRQLVMRQTQWAWMACQRGVQSITSKVSTFSTPNPDLGSCLTSSPLRAGTIAELALGCLRNSLDVLISFDTAFLSVTFHMQPDTECAVLLQHLCTCALMLPDRLRQQCTFNHSITQSLTYLLTHSLASYSLTGWLAHHIFSPRARCA